MKIFLSIISIFWLAVGIAFLIFPLKSKNFYTKMVKPVKALFILPLIAGLLFLWSASASRFYIFIKLLGILSLVKALFIAVIPKNKLVSMFDYFINRSLITWRIYGIVMMILGLAVKWGIC